MRIRLGSGLLPLNLLVIVLGIAIIFFPSSVVRIILGLPFVLFAPGYVLLAALFVKKGGIGGIERLALSLGLSIAVVALIGLILNYTPWGITLESVLYSTAFFVFIMSFIAWVRLRTLWAEERFSIEFTLSLPGWRGSTWDKVLSFVLVIAALGALGTLGYVMAMPRVGEQFTEFYILGMEGDAADYPGELVVGEEGEVILGVINQEHEPMVYRVDVTVNGEKKNEQGSMMLEHNERWEGEVGFASQVVGDHQKVEFLLYKDGETEIYSSLYIWIDVIQ